MIEWNIPANIYNEKNNSNRHRSINNFNGVYKRKNGDQQRTGKANRKELH